MANPKLQEMVNEIDRCSFIELYKGFVTILRHGLGEYDSGGSLEELAGMARLSLQLYDRAMLKEEK